MRLPVLVASKLALLAILSLASTAGATPPPIPTLPSSDAVQTQVRLPWHVGIAGGVTHAIVRHSMVVPSNFTAPTLGIHGGYNVSERLIVGFDLTTIEKYMTRDNGQAPFTPAGYVPQAECNQCEDPPVGGWVAKVTAVFGTLGPRVEFSPFGRDGLYVGGTAGVAFLWGVDSSYGFGGSARLGYRVRIGEVLGLALEGGTQAQTFGGGDYTVAPYGMVMLRPSF